MVFGQCLDGVLVMRLYVYAGWDETNFLGWDRDQEIRLMKIHYETETEKKWMMIFWTRQDRDETKKKIKPTRQDKDETVPNFFIRDETSSKIQYETETRPRVLVPLVSRPRLPSFTDRF